MVIWRWKTVGFYLALNVPQCCQLWAGWNKTIKQHSKDRLHIPASQFQEAHKELKAPAQQHSTACLLLSAAPHHHPLPPQPQTAARWLQTMTLLLRLRNSCNFRTRNKLKQNKTKKNNQHSTAPKTERDKNCAKITKICTRFFSVWRNVQ